LHFVKQAAGLLKTVERAARLLEIKKQQAGRPLDELLRTTGKNGRKRGPLPACLAGEEV